ncbi:hypothetical protein C2W62_41970 [Candidatus Entotheonella serta]|nr:hypothetical protein C2W62_41970 [Candidatus Entotheonella serta]
MGNNSIKDNGGDAIAVAANVSEEADCMALIDQARTQFGKVDILVNNAALNYYVPIVDYAVNRWIRAFAVNVHGPFILSKAVLPEMIERKHGAIVNISSGAAIAQAAAPMKIRSPEAARCTVPAKRLWNALPKGWLKKSPPMAALPSVRSRLRVWCQPQGPCITSS